MGQPIQTAGPSQSQTAPAVSQGVEGMQQPIQNGSSASPAVPVVAAATTPAASVVSVDGRQDGGDGKDAGQAAGELQPQANGSKPQGMETTGGAQSPEPGKPAEQKVEGRGRMVRLQQLK